MKNNSLKSTNEIYITNFIKDIVDIDDDELEVVIDIYSRFKCFEFKIDTFEVFSIDLFITKFQLYCEKLIIKEIKNKKLLDENHLKELEENTSNFILSANGKLWGDIVEIPEEYEITFAVLQNFITENTYSDIATYSKLISDLFLKDYNKKFLEK